MINIEMNNWYYKKLYKRNEGYLYKIFNIYENEKETFIQINIDNFNKSREIITKYEMVNVDTLERDGSIIKYRVNLALIEEKYYNDIELTKLEKELLMLRIEDKEKLEEISRGDKLMKEVNDKIVIMSDERLKELEYDYIEKMKYEMRESCFDEGMEQGSLSKQKEIAKNLLNLNMSIEDIIKATGMSKEEIENLKI